MIYNFFELFFQHLEKASDFFWGYIGFVIVLIAGAFFTIKSKGFQLRTIAKPSVVFSNLRSESKGESQGTSPIKLFFASVGGMAGLGNIVAVITAIVIGGPGALLWIWISCFAGMIIKYCEIFLGVKYRVPNDSGGYDGGPMYYLQHAFKTPWLRKCIPLLISGLIWIYCVEVYQFVVIADTLSATFDINKVYVVAVLLIMTFYASMGGIKRLANICTVLAPIFITVYFGMCLWVICSHASELPALFKLVFESAFGGHAPIGGFVGSTIVLAAQQGIARSVYSGDIAIGADSIIQSETKVKDPSVQAKLAFFSILSDALFCSMSIMVVLVTDLWHDNTIITSLYVAKALATTFPYVEYFMAVFIFLAGWTTIIAFFTVGFKAAKFIFPSVGKKVYLTYAVFAFIFCSFFDQSKVIIIMEFSGGLIMTINLIGIMKLRNKIRFK